VQRWSGAYAVAAERFAPGVVGAKSLNTLALRVRRAALGRQLVPSGCAL